MAIETPYQWPQQQPGVAVRMRERVRVAGGPGYQQGEVASFPRDVAEDLIARELADPVEPPRVTTMQGPEGVVKKAEAPAGSGSATKGPAAPPQAPGQGPRR